MNELNEAKDNLDVYVQANRQYIQEQLYNNFNVECIEMKPLKELDVAKMQSTIRNIFDFGSNKIYKYFLSHLSQNINQYIKQQYAAKAIASYYVLDIQKLTDVVEYCIKHGFQAVISQPNPPPKPKPEIIKEQTVKVKQVSFIDDGTKKVEPKDEFKHEIIKEKIVKAQRVSFIVDEPKKAQPKDEFKHVKPKISTFLEKDKIPEIKQFKIQKYGMPEVNVSPRVSSFLSKDKIPQKRQFKIEKYSTPQIKALPKVSSYLQRDKIPEKRQFKIQKYEMPEMNVLPRYLMSIPKNIVQKQPQEVPQVVSPLDNTYLIAHRKIMSERLQKLFQFYCMEQQNLGQGPTFDHIQNQMQKMNIGKFMQFCTYTKLFYSKQFQKDTLMAEYKKISKGKIQIDFQLFQKLITQLDEKYLKTMGHDPIKNPLPTYEARLMLNEPNKLGQLKKHRHLIFGTRNKDGRQVKDRADSTRYQKKLTGHSGRFSSDLQIKIKDRINKSIQTKSAAPSLDSGRIDLSQLRKLKLPKLNWIIEQQIEPAYKVGRN